MTVQFGRITKPPMVAKRHINEMGLNKPIMHINPLDPSTALRMTPLFDQTKTQVIQLPPSDEGGGARQRDGGRATEGGLVGLG